MKPSINFTHLDGFQGHDIEGKSNQIAVVKSS